MKRTIAYLFMTFIAAFVVLPSSAFAVPQHARNVMYLDENNNIIGQQMLYCNAYGSHAGVIDFGNINRIEITLGCGDLIQTCGSPNHCTTTNDYSVDITVFHSATGVSEAQYCALNPTTPGTPFYGKPDCDRQEPPVPVNQLQPVIQGYNP